MKTVLCISTAGRGQDVLRMQRLASRLDAHVTYHKVDRTVSRLQAGREVWELLTSFPWDLVYQEGTGIAGGLPLIRAALTRQQRFVVSSGDPISGYFKTKYGPWAGALFEPYERSLYQACTGFIGWTPYLTGVALKMGAADAVTVEGAVDLSVFNPYPHSERMALRQRYGIPQDHLVCGVAGSLNWVARQGWSQGYELVETLKRLQRTDVSFLIVGDGNGKARLEAAIPDGLKSRVVFTGRVPEAEVVDTLNAMDIGFVTQIRGPLGDYRLSTKLPEYLACGAAIAMSPIPGFYDYAAPAGWPLPAAHPASAAFHEQCAQWLDGLSWDEVNRKKQQALPLAQKYFDYEAIAPKFCQFMHRLLYGITS